MSFDLIKVTVWGSGTFVGLVHLTLSPALISAVCGEKTLRDIDAFPAPASTFTVEVAFVWGVALAPLSIPVASESRAIASAAEITYKNTVFFHFIIKYMMYI